MGGWRVGSTMSEIDHGAIAVSQAAKDAAHAGYIMSAMGR